MNILFFVSSLLMIFCFLASRFSLHSSSLQNETTSFSCYMEGLSTTRNMRQNKLYLTSTITEHKPVKNDVIKKKCPTIFSSHRLSYNFNESSKLDIHTLIDAELPPSDTLVKTFENLLQNLYGHTEFISALENPNWTKILAEEMKIAAKSHKDVSDLNELYPQNEKYASIYYKILKGSGFYDLSDKAGYPPLSNFIILGKSNKPPIYFNYASFPVLQALFGDEIASAIMSMERSKSESHGGRRILSKAELNALLNGPSNKKNRTSQFDQMLSFSKKTILLDNLVYKNRDKKILFTLPVEY